MQRHSVTETKPRELCDNHFREISWKRPSELYVTSAADCNFVLKLQNLTEKTFSRNLKYSQQRCLELCRRVYIMYEVTPQSNNSSTICLHQVHLHALTCVPPAS